MRKWEEVRGTRITSVGQQWRSSTRSPPVAPYKKGKLSNTTLVYKVTLEGLLSADPKHVNIHVPGSGNPPPVVCANLNEAR